MRSGSSQKRRLCRVFLSTKLPTIKDKIIILFRCRLLVSISAIMSSVFVFFTHRYIFRLGFTAVPSLPANATSLDLSGNDITYLPDNSFSYPNLQNVDLSGNHLNDKSFTTKVKLVLEDMTLINFSRTKRRSLRSRIERESATYK